MGSCSDRREAQQLCFRAIFSQRKRYSYYYHHHHHRRRLQEAALKKCAYKTERYAQHMFNAEGSCRQVDIRLSLKALKKNCLSLQNHHRSQHFCVMTLTRRVTTTIATCDSPVRFPEMLQLLVRKVRLRTTVSLPPDLFSLCKQRKMSRFIIEFQVQN